MCLPGLAVCTAQAMTLHSAPLKDNGAEKREEWVLLGGADGVNCTIHQEKYIRVIAEKQMIYAIKFYEKCFLRLCDTSVKTISLKIMTRILLMMMIFFRVE